jgi:hypothetical protein
MDNLSKETISKIKKNINNNNRTDVKRGRKRGNLTYDDFMEQLKKQNERCYICLQEFKYDGGKWCYFFPSADRINNSDIHHKDNIAISCFFCNVRCFKGISEKHCGLCENLNHKFYDTILTKSQLFHRLGNSEEKIKGYINNLPTKLPWKQIDENVFESNYIKLLLNSEPRQDAPTLQNSTDLSAPFCTHAPESASPPPLS